MLETVKNEGFSLKIECADHLNDKFYNNSTWLLANVA